MNLLRKKRLTCKTLATISQLTLKSALSTITKTISLAKARTWLNHIENAFLVILKNLKCLEQCSCIFPAFHYLVNRSIPRCSLGPISAADSIKANGFLSQVAFISLMRSECETIQLVNESLLACAFLKAVDIVHEDNGTTLALCLDDCTFSAGVNNLVSDSAESTRPTKNERDGD